MAFPPDDNNEEVTEPSDNPAEGTAEPAPLDENGDEQLDIQTGPPAPPDDWENVPNLATILPEDFLMSVGNICQRDGDLDRESMSDWLEEVAEFLDLYNAETPEPMDGQENITVVHLPFVARGITLFQSKMFPHLYQPNGDTVGLATSNPALDDVTRRCSRHMNDSLRNEIIEYLPSHDRGMKQTLLRGSTFEVWYYDPVEERPKQEICLADDVWVSYTRRSDRPDMGDVERITWRKRHYLHELEDMERSGYYAGIRTANRSITPIYEDDPYDASGAPKSATPQPLESDQDTVKDAEEANSGFVASSQDTDGQREFWEQDRWLVLKPFGEERARAVTVCLDAVTHKVVRLSLREKDDPKDKRRFRAEKQAHDMRADALQAAAEQQHAAATADHQMAMNVHLDGQDQAAALGIPADHPDLPQHPGEPPMFQPPPEEPLPAPAKRVPWHRWTHFMCDVNPEGFLGHGIPQKIAGHNKLANATGTRGVSLMTANLIPTGIMSRQSRFARGETQIKLGKIMESPLAPTQVQGGAGLFLFQFPAPDSTWFKVIELADKSCQEQTAFDVAAGAPGKAGETATENENRNSSALGNVSMIAARWDRARANSLKNLAYLYSITLPDGGVKVRAKPQARAGLEAAQGAPGMPSPAPAAPAPPAMGPPGMPPAGPGMEPGMPPAPPPPEAEPEEFIVTRDDYEQICDSLQVTFTCDPEMASKPQRVRDAQKAFQTVLQVVTTTVGPGGPPILDPMTATSAVRGAAARFLVTMDLPDLAQQILNAPLPQQPPPGAMPAPGPGGGGGGAPRKGSNGPNGPPPGAGMDGAGPAGPPQSAGG
jgi:hypothetical protein